MRNTASGIKSVDSFIKHLLCAKAWRASVTLTSCGWVEMDHQMGQGAELRGRAVLPGAGKGGLGSPVPPRRVQCVLGRETGSRGDPPGRERADRGGFGGTPREHVGKSWGPCPSCWVVTLRRREARDIRLAAVCGGCGRWAAEESFASLDSQMHLSQYAPCARNCRRLCLHCHLQFPHHHPRAWKVLSPPPSQR